MKDSLDFQFINKKRVKAIKKVNLKRNGFHLQNILILTQVFWEELMESKGIYLMGSWWKMKKIWEKERMIFLHKTIHIWLEKRCEICKNTENEFKCLMKTLTFWFLMERMILSKLWLKKLWKIQNNKICNAKLKNK